MNMLNALFFPGIKPASELVEKALFLLDSITYYQPGEEGLAENALPEGCFFRVPVPLGDDRERFTRMLSDLRINPADYYSGLIASLSSAARYDSDESSVWNLISRLHRKDGGGEDQSFKDKLWRARLVLSLAGILDEEISDVDSGLLDVNRKEQELFNALHGDIVAPEDLVELKASHGVQRSRYQVSDDVLMAAWGTLHVLDEQGQGMLLTDSESCASLLFDRWANKADAEPVRVLEVGLPAESDIKDVMGFSDARKNLRAMIQQVAEQGYAEKQLETGTLYQQILEDNNIAVSSTIEMYLLSGFSLKETFADLCGVRPVSAGHDPFLVGIIKA